MSDEYSTDDRNSASENFDKFNNINRLSLKRKSSRRIRRNENVQIAFEAVENFGNLMTSEVAKIRNYILSNNGIRSLLRSETSDENMDFKDDFIKALDINSPKSSSLPNLNVNLQNTGFSTAGLNDCSALIDESEVTGCPDRGGGIKLRSEHFGPPESDCAFDVGHVISRHHNFHNNRSSSSSGCSVCCSEQCEEKYAELSREISLLKSQVAKLSRPTTEPTVIDQHLAKIPIPPLPPPAPPLPPPDFFSAPPKKLRICSIETSETCEMFKIKRNLNDDLDPEDQKRRQRMMEILQNLKTGRANLKPVAKSPGGTPRRHSLTVFRGANRNCHNALAEALKRKFANVMNEQSPMSDAGDSSSFTQSFDSINDEDMLVDSRCHAER